MKNFELVFLYILIIGFLPLIYVTIKTLSWEKIRNRTFRKLMLKDFLRTFPVCALIALPLIIYPNISVPYLMIVQAVFVPLMFLELGHIYLFGTRIGLNTFYSLFVSNIKETREFIAQNIPLSLYIGILLFYVPPFFIIYNFPAPYYTSELYYVAIILAVWLALPFILNWNKKWPKFKDGYVLNPFSNMIYHYLEFRRNYRDLRQKIASHTSEPFAPISSELPEKQKQIYVVIIGESANSMHFSCYGYARKTCEYTDRYADHILSFSNVRSQFAQTMPSLEKTISFADEEHPDLVYDKGSLIDYFKQAGFKTYWLSNQYALDDTIITAMASHADYNKCFNYSGMKRFEKAGIDGDLLPDIEKIIHNDDLKKVIFVHLIGSHAAYVNRYPVEFRHFSDKIPNKKLSEANYQFLNSYDDSIRYTDWVLSEVIKFLQLESGANYMLYFSDHGEDVFDSNTTRLLGHSELANEPMTSVPLRLWLSDTLENVRPDIRKRAKNLNKAYKLEDLIHFILDVSSLKNADYRSEKSILDKRD